MPFRLDRHDASTGNDTLRQNLINLFTGGQKSAKDDITAIWLARLSALLILLCDLSHVVRAMFNPVSSNSMPLPTVLRHST